MKVSLFLFWISLAAGILSRGIPVELAQIRLWIERVLAPALTLGLVVWILYLALEPTIRRRWPELLISWNRVLEGRHRDPLVGRDMLVGLAVGCAVALLVPLYTLLPSLLGFPAPGPHWDNNLGTALLSVPRAAALALNVVQDSVLRVALWVGILVGFKVALRSRWLAAACLALVIALGRASASGGDLAFLFGVGAVIAVVEAVVLARFGILCFIFYAIALVELLRFPVTLEVSRWYAEAAAPALILLLLIAVLGVRSVLAKRTVSVPAVS